MIRAGELDREHGCFRNDIETYRWRVDYGSGVVERETEELLQGTTAFLEAMREQTAIDSADGSE